MDERGHTYDAVITDWRFQGADSELGGYLILIVAELLRQEPYISKGFYTGFAGLKETNEDIKRLEEYVFKQPMYEFRVFVKGNIATALANCLKDAALNSVLKRIVKREHLHQIIDELRRVRDKEVTVSDVAGDKIMLRAPDGSIKSISLGSLFPFLLIDLQKGRWDISEIRKLFNQLWEEYAGASRIIEKLYTNPFLADSLFHAEKIETAKNTLLTGKDVFKHTIQSELRSESHLLRQKVLNRIDRLFELLQNIDNLSPDDYKEKYYTQFKNSFLLSLTTTSAKGCCCLSDIIQSAGQSLESKIKEPPEYKSHDIFYCQCDLLKDGLKKLLAEIDDQGGGVDNIVILDKDEHKLLIYQENPNLYTSDNPKGVTAPRSRLARALDELEHFSDVSVIGKFSIDGNSSWGWWSYPGRVFITSLEDRNQLYIEAQNRNRAVWIIQLHLISR